MTKLRQSTLKALIRERRKLLQELGSLFLIIKGSFFDRFSICSRPNCICHKGQRHGPRSYVTVTQKKIQKQYYVPKQQVNAVRTGIKQHQRLLKIVDRITEINLTLMRGEALDENNS